MSQNLINKYTEVYGDSDTVARDISELRLIIRNHGSAFVLDVLSEFCRETATRFKIDKDERQNLIENLLTQLKDSLEERL
jgi:hypothetical protein